MTADWGITIDCSRARPLAEFWKLALGYVDAGPPQGWASWEAWFDHFSIPADERDDGASIEDPAGLRPRIGFLKVPEGKVAKNRLHLDIRISGGRHVPQPEREQRITTLTTRLVEAGASIVERHDGPDGGLDHYVMHDPEGNEFCIV